jgi:hypothetical protein
VENQNGSYLKMTDFLGPSPTRVLDSSNRSFESVVYQWKKPPLSCEVNFGGNLDAGRGKDVSQFVGPSGWITLGYIKDNVPEASARVGDVITSSSYPANSFKLMALDQGSVLTGTLVAWVNGMKVVVQGTGLPSEDNLITLSPPPSASNRVDFVFLEVWRKLITPSDVVYTHGNVLYGGVNYPNDLIDPAINVETSLRIQVQYRIRVAAADLVSYPEGFDPNRVFAQGPLSSPLSCPSACFVSVPGDPGLWRAGVGDSASQESLQTVDGYTYAIPMFAVCRRNTSAFSPDIHTNGSIFTRQDYLNGTASDRPDNLYSDLIVADDILDMRKTIKTDNLKDVCNEALRILSTGKLRSKIQLQTNGEDRYSSLAMEIDGISYNNPGWFNAVSIGNGVRRVFSGATLAQKHTLAPKTPADQSGPASGTWVAGRTVTVSSTYAELYPTGTTISGVQTVWAQVSSSTLQTLTVGVDYSISMLSGIAVVTLLGGFLAGTSYTIVVDYTIQYPSINSTGPSSYGGLYFVPERVLESRRSDSTVAFPAIGSGFQVHGSNSHISPDGTFSNMVVNKGANSDPYDFGVQLVYNVYSQGTSNISIPRNIWGYEILGVISIYAPGTGDSRPIATVARSSTTYSISYAGTIIPNGHTIQLTLYVGASSLNSNVPSKFFQTNKQGRAVVDTFQMKELLPTQSATGQSIFYVDSNSEGCIRAIASTKDSSAFLPGAGAVYVNSILTPILNSNTVLPTDQTCSRATIQFASPPPVGAIIEVPVLMNTAISGSESYQLYYQTVPYQGLLDSTTYGKIEIEGPAFVSTSGSGAITDLTYSIGTASFNGASVTGNGTSWTAFVKPGYVITPTSQPNRSYKIISVNGNTSLTIQGNAGIVALGGYTITAVDVPSFSPANLNDRMPVLDFDSDDLLLNEVISTSISDAYQVIESRIISRPQDIIDAPADSVQIGIYPAARGRCVTHISDSSSAIGMGNLGLKFERMSATINGHAKTYQAYILNKENKGELYLMVVGSESDNVSQSRQFIPGYSIPQDRDVVDIFQIPGRPIKNGKSI